MKILRFAFCAIISLSIASESARAQIIASAGFNDASGINSNPTPNSPYNINNAALNGQGAGEPGWLSPWQVVVSSANVVNSGQAEGDGAAFFDQNTTRALRNLALPLSGSRSLLMRMQIASSATSGNSINMYIRQQSNQQIGPNWVAFSDGRFMVVDGNESGTPNLIDTGLFWTPGAYQELRIDVDTVSRTWKFSVDGVMFNSPTPLGYRDSPIFLDQFEFLSAIGNPNGSFLDSVVFQVPEPTSIALLGFASCGFAGSVIRRAKRRNAA